MTSEHFSISHTEAEQLPDVEYFDKQHQTFLSPIFRDPRIVEQLMPEDSRFIDTIVAAVAEKVFVNTYLPDTHITSLWVTEAYGQLSQGRSFTEIAAALDESGRTSRTEVVRKLREFTRAVPGMFLMNPKLDAAIMDEAHDYMRTKHNNAQRAAEVLQHPGIGLRDVLEAMQDKGHLSEAQYYAFGVHAGVVTFRGAPPQGETKQEAVERWRKRALVTPEALQSAIDAISNKYTQKQRVVAARRNQELPLRPQAQQVFSLLLGRRVDGTDPVSRDNLLAVFERRRLDGVSGAMPSQDDIERYLTEALIWTFTPVQKYVD
ncbi:hypothetical protein H7Y40_00620 [Pedobacter sp.]|nr:hypothetical protein [Candidatus Saccharibacteria bacterium]